MNKEVFATMTAEDRRYFIAGLEASGFEVWQSYGDVEFDSSLAAPGRSWGDRPLVSVRVWPTAQEGETVVDGDDRYIVIVNVVLDGVSGVYTRRAGVFARMRIGRVAQEETVVVYAPPPMKPNL